MARICKAEGEVMSAAEEAMIEVVMAMVDEEVMAMVDVALSMAEVDIAMAMAMAIMDGVAEMATEAHVVAVEEGAGEAIIGDEDEVAMAGADVALLLRKEKIIMRN